MRSIGTLVSAGTLAIVTAMGMGSAMADPASTTDYRPLAGVGSDTTTPVMNALANDPVALAISGARQVASYNATGSAQITTKDPAVNPNCTIARPNGSTSGRTALLASLTAGPGGTPNGCLQFARASDLFTGDANPNLVYIPFAGENVTVAINNASSFPKNVTRAQVTSLFNCSLSVGQKAMFPQSGSGTFAFWVKEIFPSGTMPNPVPACIQNGVDENGTTIQEHNGTLVGPLDMVPMSVAQWTSQVAGIIAADVRGNTRLIQVDGMNPFGSGFPINRPLFNAITEAAANGDNANSGALQRTVFVGQNALACSGASSNIMSRFGLAISPDCGDISLVTQ